MALGLVHLQDVADTAIELWIDVLQAVGHVLMYSRFGYMKLLGGGADRRVVFNNILTEFDGSFFNGSFHVYHPLQLLATILCAASFEYAPFSAGIGVHGGAFSPAASDQSPDMGIGGGRDTGKRIVIWCVFSHRRDEKTDKLPEFVKGLAFLRKECIIISIQANTESGIAPS